MGLSLQTQRSLERIIEADRFGEAPHPRENLTFFGHVATEQSLLQQFCSGHMPHACLISGLPGIGKATLAWRLARFILANPNPARKNPPVGNSLNVPQNDPVVRQIVAMSHPDVFVLRREWNAKEQQLSKDIRVDDVRKASRVFRRATSDDRFRICIIDSVDDLNPESANALLKIIEEPPPRSLFLLVAHKADRVLPTIRSRCQKILLKPLSPADLSAIIDALGPPWSDASREELWAAISSARGSIHDVVRRLVTSGAQIAETLDQTMAELPRLDWHKIHALADLIVRPDGTQAFDTLLIAAFDWLDREATRLCDAGQGIPVATTIAYARAWESVAGLARRSADFNLDRRPVVLALFEELAGIAGRVGTRNPVSDQ